MKVLLTRTITGIIFVSVVVLSIVSRPVILLNVFLIFTCLALYEYRNLLTIKNIHLHPLYFIVALLLYFLLGYTSLWKIELYKNMIPFIAIGLLFLFPIFELFLKNETSPLQNTAASISGIIFIVCPLALINHFSLLCYKGEMILLAVFIIIWSYDTLAYCIGSLLGKHPLLKRISPKKTWEGMLGATLCILILSYFFVVFFPALPFTHVEWMGLAAVIVVTGTLGDLIESMFKRQLDVKDSGSILPGHGGILDRFDSILFSIPFVFIYLHFII